MASEVKPGAHAAGCGVPRGQSVCRCWCHGAVLDMTPEVRRVVFALAREALAIRDSYDKRGWVMNPLPHEAEVRAVLGGPEPPDDEPEPEWFEGADGFVRAPLSYENREGDPAFNGAFDKW